MTGRSVEVEWEDSSLQHGWKDRNTLTQQPAQCVTRGLVERDDERGMLIIFQTADYGGGEHGFEGSSFIPRSAIRRVWELRRNDC